MTRNRGALMALGAGLTFVLLVSVVQVLAPAITPIDPYGLSGAAQKKEQMERVANAGPVDIVFTGTSQILVSVDPKIIDAAAGTVSYNASLTGGTPQIQVEWLLDHVVPTLQPRQVVIGVSNLDLLDVSPRLNGVIESWNSGRANHDGVLAELDRSLSDSVALVDRRQSLRDPAEWVRAVLRRAEGTQATLPGLSNTLTDEGLEQIWADVEYQNSDEVLAFMRNEVVPTYSIGEKQTSALRRMVAALQDEGIDVVLLLMPMTADIVELHPNGQADVTKGIRALETLADEAGVEILRYDRSDWPDALFSDPIHLNGKGGELFSRLIASDVAAAPNGTVPGGDHTAAGDVAIAEFTG